MIIALPRATTRWLSGACLWLAASAMPVAQAQDDAGEDAVLVKTAFVYNFAKFTRWPAGATPETAAPLTLCIAGEDDLAEGLGRLKGKVIKGRALAIQAIKGARAARNCDLLYVAASEQGQLAELIKATRELPILTVSEVGRFAQQGGMIELYREQGRVRFIINLGATRAAGLEINPSLLALAVVIGQ